MKVKEHNGSESEVKLDRKQLKTSICPVIYGRDKAMVNSDVKTLVSSRMNSPLYPK